MGMYSFVFCAKTSTFKKKKTHNGAEDVRRMPGEKVFIYTE